MITLIVQLFGRTETTQHADEADMFGRIYDIAIAQKLRVERIDPHNQGELISGETVVGGYQFTEAA